MAKRTKKRPAKRAATGTRKNSGGKGGAASANGLTLERWPIERLKPHPKNPRTHDEKNLAAIEASIARCGYIAPIVVNQRSGYIVAGHGRLAAAKRLVAKGQQKYAELDVVVVSLDAATERAYLLADNRTSELAAWDRELLLALAGDAQDDDNQPLLDTLHMSQLIDLSRGKEAATEVLPAMEYRVLVTAKDEKHQAKLIARFEKEGLECRAIIS